MKKRLLSTLLALCMVLTLLPTAAFAVEDSTSFDIWDGSIANSYAGGSGTSSSPYLIETAAQLARVASQENSGAERNKCYKLINDIYLNDISTVDSWSVVAPENEWIPIGTSSAAYSGTFDGAGYTIHGIYISIDEDYQGLFGRIGDGCAIRNLGVEDSYIKGRNYVGAICGYRNGPGFLSGGELTGCHSGATVIGLNYVGGVFGRFDAELVFDNLKNCYNTGTVSGEQKVGGIVGGSVSLSISDCYNTGTVSGITQIGGIAGAAMQSSRCWNAGKISGSSKVGGVFGEATYYAGTSSNISSSFNTGAISGDSYVGGIIGYSNVYSGLYPSAIQNCYNMGTITGTGDYIGGIAGQGYLCKYINCYNAGTCSFGTGTNVGAVFNNGARNESTNCYYLEGCCGKNYYNGWSSVVTEKTSNEMQAPEFVNTLGSAWLQDTMGYNAGYPILNGIDYETFRDYLISSNAYQFKAYGNNITNCLAVGERLELNVGCYLNNLLDSTAKEFTTVISNDDIVNISIGNWDDTHGKQYYIFAKNVGETTITFSNSKIGVSASLDIFVIESEAGYTFDYVPRMIIEDGKTTNFYNYSGLVVDEFSYRPHHVEGSEEIDYYIVTMNVYNKSNLYGAVSAYDAHGDLSGFSIIDKMETSKTSFVGSLTELYYSVGDLFYLCDNSKFYSGKSISKESKVEINVPVGGYLSISMNPIYSEVALFANVIGLSVEFASTLSDFVEKADALPDDITDVLVDGDFKKNVIYECIKEFTSDYANKQILKACKDTLISQAHEINWNYDSLTEWYNTILDTLQKSGIDVVETVEKKLFTLTGVASVSESILKKAIVTGKLIDMLYTWVEVGNFVVFAVNFSKSFDCPKGLYIYAPTTESSYLSNGITADTTTTDPEVVVHAYQVVDTSNAGLEDSLFTDCVYEVYSITMYKSGVVVQPDAEVTVKIPLSDAFKKVDASKIKVYRHNDDGSLTNMNANILDGYIIFITDHFSYYSIVAGDEIKTVVTITFNANGGNLTDVATMVTGENGKLFSLPTNPTFEGHTFVGWFTGIEDGDPVTTETVFTSDTTIYAHWTEVGHNFSNEWGHDENNHWHDCTDTDCNEKSGLEAHKWDNGVETKAPTYENDGVKTYTCSVCQRTKTETIPKLGHHFSNNWGHDENNHWHNCTDPDCNEKSGLEAHKWDNGAETAAPTYEKDGLKTYTCSVCQRMKTETIPKLEHHFSNEWSHDANNHWHNCTDSDCNEKSGLETHKWDQGVETEAPTYEKDGVKTYTCSVCQRTKTESIPKLGHHFSPDWTKDDDYHWHECTDQNCNETSGKGAHTWNDGEITVEPSFEAPGVKTYTCSICGATKTGSVPQLVRYTVTFDANGGTLTGGISMTTDGNGKLASLPTPTRNGYIFDGWYTAKAGGTKVTTGSTFTKDTTVYAHWTVKSSGGGSIPSNPSYQITVSTTSNGTVTVTPTSAKSGTKVTIISTPNEGYTIDSVTVTRANGNEVEVTNNGDGTYTFVMPASKVTVTATFTAIETPWINPFTDVSESDWFYDGVAYVVQNGLMIGVGNQQFNPSGTTSRGMIVTILYRLEGEPTVSQSTFTDVEAGQYYTDAVAWAAANKIVAGYGNNTFGPDDDITREQIVTILYNYATYKGYDVSRLADLSGYTDTEAISSWALTAMRWANNEGLMTGRTTIALVPKGNATRAEAATILTRFRRDIDGLE